ncbi:uncharacterized protein TM35_000131030 [Trypanosoma theileri]|uniref:Uncharacterized protein n=1 Tax=Trypanosoma theileri TaxID=67003 RepID=A0A1X0NXZ5_9TRYP|nr:uncharacterized protein TM35_000131030 [Trypanosoma theileri]ORC89099.1 hypothetical protein TM35_000131030 [Trypanosoma theileri]
MAHGGGDRPLPHRTRATTAKRICRHRSRLCAEQALRIHERAVPHKGGAGGLLLHRRTPQSGIPLLAQLWGRQGNPVNYFTSGGRLPRSVVGNHVRSDLQRTKRSTRDLCRRGERYGRGG